MSYTLFLCNQHGTMWLLISLVLCPIHYQEIGLLYHIQARTSIYMYMFFCNVKFSNYLMTACFVQRFILTLSDYFSKWVEAVALPTKEATGVANQLYKVCVATWINHSILSLSTVVLNSRDCPKKQWRPDFTHLINPPYNRL